MNNVPTVAKVHTEAGAHERDLILQAFARRTRRRLNLRRPFFALLRRVR